MNETKEPEFRPVTIRETLVKIATENGKLLVLLQKYHDKCPCTSDAICPLCKDACDYL